jgi:putative transposase
VLKEAGAGVKLSDLRGQHGISDATYYTSRSKYGGLEIFEMRRLRQLEQENRRLKSIVADQALDIRARSQLKFCRMGSSDYTTSDRREPTRAE